MSDYRNRVYLDPGPSHVANTARATERVARESTESRELIQQMVEHAIATAEATEVRERQMLRWTQAGVLLAAVAAVAAVASLVAIIVTVVVSG